LITIKAGSAGMLIISKVSQAADEGAALPAE